MKQPSFLILLIFYALNVILSVEALRINCNYFIEIEQFPELKNLYTCDGTVDFSGDQSKVEYVSSNHMAGKNNANVQSVYFRHQAAIKFFPRDLYKFFPNLEAVKFHQTNLEYVGKEHLFGLKSLRAVDFYGNQLKAVGNNLFEHQPNQIEGISFTSNPLRNIGFNVFSQMLKLRSLHFDFTTDTCFGGTCNNDLVCVARRITEFTPRCPPTVEMALDMAAELNGKSQNTLKTKVRCIVDA